MKKTKFASYKTSEKVNLPVTYSVFLMVLALRFFLMKSLSRRGSDA